MKPAIFLLFTASAVALDFDREIRPLLQERCIECHGEKKQKGELRLDAQILSPSKADMTGPLSWQAKRRYRLCFNASFPLMAMSGCRRRGRRFPSRKSRR